MWNLPGKLEDGIPASKGDIHVGCDVWIGTDAMILSGVTIGHGAVIAARSVVTKDIPPYAVAAGSPARVIRYRFPPDQIQALLDLQWWSWPEHKVLEAVPLLSGPKISDFIRTNSR
jgi:tetrahydrodipicolinate N-succinyltransferase